MSVAPNSTVAVSPTNRQLSCGARVFVPGVGTRLVTDNGAGLRDDQLDHYSGVSGCNRTAGTIGTAPAFRLF